MQRKIIQIIILLLVASICLSGFLIARHILHLPFRPTNDTLHKKNSAFTLDFLIPSGTHLDEAITIGEVIKIRFTKEKTPYEKVLRAILDLIPHRYRFLANLFLFLFWFLCFMTLFRVFTFMGYGRSFRVSLLCGGITYYFMPDFSPGKGDDTLFIGLPLLIILLRTYIHRREEKRKVQQG
jgi:hypothetical protein